MFHKLASLAFLSACVFNAAAAFDLDQMMSRRADMLERRAERDLKNDEHNPQAAGSSEGKS